MKADELDGFGRLAESERLYYMVLTDVVHHGKTKYAETELDLLRRGHLEEYDQMLKLTDSGFQLLDFLKMKMSGDRPPIVREA